MSAKRHWPRLGRPSKPRSVEAVLEPSSLHCLKDKCRSVAGWPKEDCTLSDLGLESSLKNLPKDPTLSTSIVHHPCTAQGFMLGAGSTGLLSCSWEKKLEGHLGV
ncbi:hypothetical protein DPEC_G00037390 [Dallia pectoralis]|uniref:Uncharacterized protein n=1 Tax=Dallia pectoralis TaxID=75939 RepID=A0ACC2HE85_DALPE|nr:hypothetical protein DPEC_G00037390 [Dallia pectoralis]